MYSLGVVLYELLTGHRPYELEDCSTQETERIVCEENPEKPSIVIGHKFPVRQNGEQLTPEDNSGRRNCTLNQLRRHLERDIDYILLHAMRKEPQQRFETAAEFSDDLQKWLDLGIVDPNTPLFERLRLWCKRNPSVSALTSIVIVLVLLVAVVATVGYLQKSNALAKGKEALKQKGNALKQVEQIRLAFLETTYFKLREEAVVVFAKDPK